MLKKTIRREWFYKAVRADGGPAIAARDSYHRLQKRGMVNRAGVSPAAGTPLALS
ncbi:MAG: hypothetical protein NTV22_03170 [bacterium]|nr:hypothetical protein [bacterium]